MSTLFRTSCARSRFSLARTIAAACVVAAWFVAAPASAQVVPPEAPAQAGPPVEVTVSATASADSVRLVLTHDRETTKAVMRRGRDVEIGRVEKGDGGVVYVGDDE